MSWNRAELDAFRAHVRVPVPHAEIPPPEARDPFKKPLALDDLRTVHRPGWDPDRLERLCRCACRRTDRQVSANPCISIRQEGLTVDVPRDGVDPETWAELVATRTVSSIVASILPLSLFTAGCIAATQTVLLGAYILLFGVASTVLAYALKLRLAWFLSRIRPTTRLTIGMHRLTFGSTTITYDGLTGLRHHPDALVFLDRAGVALDLPTRTLSTSVVQRISEIVAGRIPHTDDEDVRTAMSPLLASISHDRTAHGGTRRSE